jgi:hypothetical protein
MGFTVIVRRSASHSPGDHFAAADAEEALSQLEEARRRNFHASITIRRGAQEIAEDELRRLAEAEAARRGGDDA